MYNRVKRAIDSTWTSSIAGKCTPVPHSHSVLYLPVYSVTFSYVFLFLFRNLIFLAEKKKKKKRVRSSRCCLCWLTGWLIQASHYSSLTLSPPFCMSVLSESRYCRRFFFLLHLPRLIAPRTHALAGSRHGLKDQSIVPTV